MIVKEIKINLLNISDVRNQKILSLLKYQVYVLNGEMTPR